MAYSELLAMRFRDALGRADSVVEKRMMGGLVFMLNGNMLGGVTRDSHSQGRFMFRVGPDQAEDAISRPGAVQMEMGGRVMKGFIFVAEAEGTADLGAWIAMARRFVDTLPPK